MAVNRVTGLQNIQRNIARHVRKMGKVTMAGLLEGGAIVQGTSQDRVPVLTGNLKGSAYTRKAQSGDLAAEVGYTAAYAVYVHENLEQTLKGEPRSGGKGEYWDNGQPKFLESALYDEERSVLNAIQRHARIRQ